ncbi:hypothetical protein [Enterobacter asburiae]|uniref:hypothetical protein n=1 Tax=Enterobacter asburiae TaxID=61645 RepID=UPI000A8BAB65|nr:hypothetical protein [Enterobacter asburiae]MDE7597219.1 hypothetical protein [Enterobacter asburiae]
MERGVVFTSCELLSIEGGRGFQTGRAISPEELNYLTLYWDKLVSPTNNFIHLGLINEDELIKCGVLTRLRFVEHGFMDGTRMTNFHARTHIDALNLLKKKRSRCRLAHAFF